MFTIKRVICKRRSMIAFMKVRGLYRILLKENICTVLSPIKLFSISIGTAAPVR